MNKHQLRNPLDDSESPSPSSHPNNTNNTNNNNILDEDDDGSHRFTISDYLDTTLAGTAASSPGASSAASPSASPGPAPSSTGPLARVQAGPSRSASTAAARLAQVQVGPPLADRDIEAIASPPATRLNFSHHPTAQQTPVRSLSLSQPQEPHPQLQSTSTPVRQPPPRPYPPPAGASSASRPIIGSSAGSIGGSSASTSPVSPQWPSAAGAGQQQRQLQASSSSTSTTTPPRAFRKPVPDPLGVMVSPLGPGPEPYPNSPDGHASDDVDERPSIDYVPHLTYPPRAGYPGYSDSQPAYKGARTPRSPPMTSPPHQTMSGGAGPSNSFARQQSTPRHPLPPGAADPVDMMSPMTTAAGMLSDSEDDHDEKHMPPPPPEKTGARGLDMSAKPLPSPQNKVVVWLKKLIPTSLVCRLLLLVVFLEAVLDIGIQANILWRFQIEVDSQEQNNVATEEIEVNKRRLPVYLYIFVSAHIIQICLTVYAIRKRNTIQVIGLAIFNGLFLVYAAIEIGEVRKILGNATPAANAATTHDLLTLPLNVLTALSITIVSVSFVAVVVLSWFIWREFGWDIYRFLGADLRIRHFYFQYQIFETIVTFSFFFFAGFGVQFALLILGKSDPEYIITWVMFPLLLVGLALGIIGARFEVPYLMASFLVELLAGTAYFIYKLVRIWTDSDKYKLVAMSLTAFAVLSLIMIILCIVYGSLVWHNFGKGLKQHVADKKKDQKAQEQMAMGPSSGFSSGNMPSRQHHRLTID